MKEFKEFLQSVAEEHKTSKIEKIKINHRGISVKFERRPQGSRVLCLYQFWKGLEQWTKTHLHLKN